MNKYVAEFYGTFLLLVSILGTFYLSSTVLGAPDHITVLLIALAVAATLFSNINIFIKVSGAHFNPAISYMMFIKGNLNLNDCLLYILMLISGGVLCVIVSHIMFGADILSVSEIDRSPSTLLLAELIATSGLLIVIAMLEKSSPEKIPSCVALFILAATFFTSSTCFANPAVTFARIFTDSGVGIDIYSAFNFLIVQFVSALIVAKTIKS